MHRDGARDNYWVLFKELVLDILLFSFMLDFGFENVIKHL